MGLTEKIAAIELEMSKTQKNKVFKLAPSPCIPLNHRNRLPNIMASPPRHSPAFPASHRRFSPNSPQLANRLSASLTLSVGLLKGKLARYRAELLEPDKKSKAGEGFDVSKEGSGRSVLAQPQPIVAHHEAGLVSHSSDSLLSERVRSSRN